MGASMSKEHQNNEDNFGLDVPGREGPVSHYLSNKSHGTDEVPHDIRGFLVHPLMAAESAPNGDDHASALALLHEYENLPTIDKGDMKIHDKYGPLMDTLLRQERGELAKMDHHTEFTMLFQDPDVDAFLNNKDCSPDSCAGDVKKCKTDDIPDDNISKDNPVVDPQRNRRSPDQMNQRDTFLLVANHKDNMESPLDTFVKDEPDLSPEAPDMEFSAALAYPTFDLHHFQDEDSLMEELNNSLNGHGHFAGNDTDDFVPNISSNLLQALDMPPATRTHDSIKQTVSNCDSWIHKHANSFGSIHPDTAPNISSLNTNQQTVSKNEHDANTIKKPCAIHGPFHSQKNTSRSVSEVCVTNSNSHQSHLNLGQQSRPPPAYIPPELTKFSNTPPPPPYKTPPSNADSNDQDTPPPKLMPIEYLFSPRSENESTLPASTANRQPTTITIGSPPVVPVTSPEQPMVTQGQSVQISHSPLMVVPDVDNNITAPHALWPSATDQLFTNVQYRPNTTPCVSAPTMPSMSTQQTPTTTTMVPAIVAPTSSSEVKPRCKKRKKSTVAPIVIPSSPMTVVQRPSSLSINTDLAFPPINTVTNQHGLMVQRQFAEQQKQQLAHLQMQQASHQSPLLQQQLSQASVQPQAHPKQQQAQVTESPQQAQQVQQIQIIAQQTSQQTQHISSSQLANVVTQVLQSTSQTSSQSQQTHLVSQPSQDVQHVPQMVEQPQQILRPTGQIQQPSQLTQQLLQSTKNVQPAAVKQVDGNNMSPPNTLQVDLRQEQQQEKHSLPQITQQIMLQHQQQQMLSQFTQHQTQMAQIQQSDQPLSQQQPIPKTMISSTQPQTVPVSLPQLCPSAVIGHRLPHIIPIPPGFSMPPGVQVLIPPVARPPFSLPAGSVPMPPLAMMSPSIQSSTGSTPVRQIKTPVTAINTTTLPHLIFCPPYGMPPRCPEAPVTLTRPPMLPTKSIAMHVPPSSIIGQCTSAMSGPATSPVVIKTEVLTPTSEEPSASPFYFPSATTPTSVHQLLKVSSNSTTSTATSPVSQNEQPLKQHHCAIHGLVSKRLPLTVSQSLSGETSNINAISPSNNPAVVPPIQHVQPLIDSMPLGTSIVTCATPPKGNGATPIRLPVPPGTTLLPVPAPPGAPTVNGVTPHYVIPIRVPSSASSPSTPTTQGVAVAPFPPGFPPRYLIPIQPGIRSPLPTNIPYITVTSPAPGIIASQSVSLNSTTSTSTPPTQTACMSHCTNTVTTTLNTSSVKSTPQLIVRPSSTPIHHENPIVMSDQSNRFQYKQPPHAQSAPTTPSRSTPFASVVASHLLSVPSSNCDINSISHNEQSLSPISINQHNVVDSNSKPSDSTKRIIEVLRAQMTHNASEPSFNYISDILLNESVSPPSSGVTLNYNGNCSTDNQKSDIKPVERSVSIDTKATMKPARLFPPPPKITVTSPVDNKPFLSGSAPGMLLTQSSNSPLTQIVSPVQIVSPTQVVHPTVVTTTIVTRDAVPPKVISIPQTGAFPPPNHRVTSTHILHKPAAIVHPASSPTLAHLKKVDPKAGELGPVVVITPQTQGLATQTTATIAYSNHGNTELRSPDSGFNETCVSPADPSLMPYCELHESQPQSPNDGLSKRMEGRRRSSGCLKTTCPAALSSKAVGTGPVFAKLDPELCCFRYCLETNTSTSQRIDEDRITYLNKGQFYGLTLEYVPRVSLPPVTSSVLKSNIVVVFRDDKSPTDELRSWEFWHTRQHSFKQRILDIDTKNSSGVLPNSIEELSHNAVTIRWSPHVQSAKISIAIHCLSTDFSNQKGVKGLPLHIIVDTFEDGNDAKPIHKGFCQVKVFCDKGAERKARDEERRKEAKSKLAETNAGRRRVEEIFHPHCDYSEFYHMPDLDKEPVLFTPSLDAEDYAKRLPISPVEQQTFNGGKLGYEIGSEGPSPAKRMRTNSYPYDAQKVLLYVREENEAVFTALLLHRPDMTSLVTAIEEKYNIPTSHIRNIYKRSKKGILVKMDDNILAHYSNESTFIIDMKPVIHVINGDGMVDVTLMEINGDIKS